MSEPTTAQEEVPASLEEMVQKADRSRRWDKRVKWGLFWVLMIGGLAGFFWLGQVTADRDTAKAEAANEQQAKKDIAVEARAALCQAGEVAVYDANLCDQLEKIAEEPSRLEQGPQGIQGVQGVTGTRGPAGKDGADGPPGPAGANGVDGAEGVNGLNGELGPAGADGADSTVPGPAGPPGSNGSDGAPGSPGPSGRGITSVTCEGAGEASYWLVTYDDGTTQTSGGPCRLEPVPIPSPTS